MKNPAILLKNLLPLGSVKLGRFVDNAMYPQQGFLDPLDSEPESIERSQENFQETLSLSKSTKLRSCLTALLSMSYQSHGANDSTLTVKKTTTYQLLNSEAWFQNACKNRETRNWLEQTLQYSEDVYLVVGYCTVTDAKLRQGATFRGVAGGGVQLPDAPVGGGVLCTTLSVDNVREVNNRAECEFVGPGEQVYAIQYRKLRFGWFSSRKIEKSKLERDNRWKIFWSPDIRGGTDEDDGEDDVVEVDLTDELDLEFNDVYVDEDGMELMF